MYICLKEEYLEKHKTTMRKEAKKAECEKGDLLNEDIDETIEDIEFNDGELSLYINTALGFFSITIPIDDDMAFQIIDYMKAKGQKIQKLINLVTK